MPTTVSRRSPCRPLTGNPERPLGTRASAIAAARYDGAARLASSSNAGSGNRKMRSTAADRDRPGDRTNHLSVARFNGSKGVLIGYYLDSADHGKRPPAEIQRLALEHGGGMPRSTPPSSKRVLRLMARVAWSRGSWRSESARRMKRSRRCANPTVACIRRDYMTNMSSWMQGAFESAREISTSLHKRAAFGN